MKEIFHSEDREILRDLYKSATWTNVYFFHQKYLLSPAQISRAIRKFEAEGLIEISDDSIKMTAFGRKWLLKNRRHVFIKPADMQWKVPYTGLCARQVRQNKYTPRPSKMRRAFFEEI